MSGWHPRVSTNRKRMDPAAHAAGLSPFYCKKCGKHFDKEQEEKALTDYASTCSGCGSDVYTSMMGLTIRPEDGKFLRPAAVRRHYWWHATYREHWYQDLYDSASELEGGHAPLVHIGTLASALDRADVVKAIYLYKVKISPDAVISRFVVEDDNEWPEDTGDVESVLEYSKMYKDVTRYVNRYEVPGSVSLLADYRSLQPVSVGMLDRPWTRALQSKSN